MPTTKVITNKPPRRRVKIERGRGNVFADLGVGDPEVALAKAELARRIDRIIRKRGLTQTETAGILGVDQGKVSALVRGRLAGFSLERLFRFLTALGSSVQIVVKERRSTNGTGAVRVASTI